MDYKRVENLLDKYFNGETEVHEEQQLQNYFNSNEVHEDLLSYQPLFQYFNEEKVLTLSDDFDQKLLQQLSQTENRQFKQRRLYPILMRVAAAAVLAIGVFFAFRQMNQVNQQDQLGYIKATDSTEMKEMTPEEAYEEVMAALALVSSKLNKGEKKALESLGQIDKATKIIKQ